MPIWSLSILAAAARNEAESDAENEKKENKRPFRVVITTHTIALQEQILHKDYPFLNSVIPYECSAVLVKGRGNYISLRRLHKAVDRAGMLFDKDEHAEQLRLLRDWSKETSDGSLADLNYAPHPSVWEEVVSDSSNCMGKACAYNKECFYYASRRRMAHAQILVVNHALFFSDLALRIQNQDAGFLPEYDVVVFDEAHTLEAVAGDHLGLSLSSSQVDFALRRLYNEQANRGLLVHHKMAQAQKLVSLCGIASSDFFNDVLDWFETHTDANGRVRESEIVENRLSPRPFSGGEGSSRSSETHRRPGRQARPRLRGKSRFLVGEDG